MVKVMSDALAVLLADIYKAMVEASKVWDDLHITVETQSASKG